MELRLDIDRLPTTEVGQRIMCQDGIASDVINHFIKRNNEYGEGANDLGIRGQFADINRKFIRLRRLMWDNPHHRVPTDQEGLEEILIDLIGHCYLTIDMVRQAKHWESDDQ